MSLHVSALDAHIHGKHVVICMGVVGLGRHLRSRCDAHRDLYAHIHGKHVVICMGVVGLGRHLRSRCDAHRDLCPQGLPEAPLKILTARPLVVLFTSS